MGTTSLTDRLFTTTGQCFDNKFVQIKCIKYMTQPFLLDIKRANVQNALPFQSLIKLHQFE